jgi:hypothetical protein
VHRSERSGLRRRGRRDFVFARAISASADTIGCGQRREDELPRWRWAGIPGAKKLHRIASPHGRDGFLIETGAVGTAVRDLLGD